MANLSSLTAKVALSLAAVMVVGTGIKQASFAPAYAANETPASVSVGKAAPDFTLKDLNGKEHKLSDYKGKFVVLEWFNDGCPFVQKHYKSDNMQKLQGEFTKKGVVWLTINSSAVGKQGNHPADQYKKIESEWKASPSAFLLDADGKVGHLYGAKTTPDMFIINKSGELVYSGAIDDTPGTDVAEIEHANNYVKSALEESMGGKKVAVASTKSYGCSVKYAE